MDDSVRDELTLLRTSLLDGEFSFDSSLDASDIARLTQHLEDGDADNNQEMPHSDVKLTLLASARLALVVRYGPRYTSPATYSIAGGQLPAALQARVNEKLLEEVQRSQDEAFPSFAIFTALQAFVSDELSQDIPALDDSGVPPVQTASATVTIKQVMLWSHHLLATGKRKSIIQWSTELSLFGVSKVGYPGLIFVEGFSDEVDEFVDRIKALNWKALQVRSEVETASMTLSGEQNSQVARTDLLWRECQLAKAYNRSERISVMEKETMAEVSAMMSVAGLEDTFYTAMKIQKSH